MSRFTRPNYQIERIESREERGRNRVGAVLDKIERKPLPPGKRPAEESDPAKAPFFALGHEMVYCGGRRLQDVMDL